jgi:hypothetical protein
MSEAVAAYADYRGSSQAWALGRFVVPMARVDELAAGVSRIHGDGAPWPVSAVSTALPPTLADATAIRNAHRSVLLIDCLETRAATPGEVTAVVELVDAGFRVFVELTPDDHLEAMVSAVARAGAAAKLRTGGVTPGAFPAPESVLRFMRTCARAGVPMKATAGLHHPVRGEYALTYAPDSVRGTMFGYLNVLLAAALVMMGRDDSTVLAVLREESPEAFRADGASLAWRNEHIGPELLETLRATFITGFGSCSFREPLDEMPGALTTA